MTNETIKRRYGRPEKETIMTIKEILQQYLKQNGYDGLSCPAEECGCLIDDLMPCDCVSDECKAGHKVKDDGGLFIVAPGKRPDNEAQV